MTTCESCGCTGDFHTSGCPALQGNDRDQRIRDAERAVLAAAERLFRTWSDDDGSPEAADADYMARKTFGTAVRTLREARKGTP